MINISCALPTANAGGGYAVSNSIGGTLNADGGWWYNRSQGTICVNLSGKTDTAGVLISTW